MSDSDDANTAPTAALPSDPIQPLASLSAVSSRMDSLQRFLSDSISRNVLLDPRQMDSVSSEISSAVHQAILSASALLSLSQSQSQSPPIPTNQSQSKPPQSQSKPPQPQSKPPVEDEVADRGGDYEVIELDSVELLAEHVHFCDICGKGFKRDANLRMHMRAHGDQFKRPEALAKPPPAPSPETPLNLKETRFSCPFAGCNRNQHHRKFRALKSVICVRNHFKRSHCPKMYSCNRCNKKSFSVLADLKSHLKNCGESKWRCSCGTTFSRKDKLFGHMALFEGHMPAIAASSGVVVVDDDDLRSKTASTPAFMDEDEVVATSAPAPAPVPAPTPSLDAFFDAGMFADQLPGIDDRYIQQMFGSSSSPDYVFFNM